MGGAREEGGDEAKWPVALREVARGHSRPALISKMNSHRLRISVQGIEGTASVKVSALA